MYPKCDLYFKNVKTYRVVHLEKTIGAISGETGSDKYGG